MLIGLTGSAGVGKNTVATILGQRHDYFELAFADSLKTAASVIFGLTTENFYDPVLKETTCPYWEMTPRKMLQKLGTEGCREVFGPDIWIKSLARSLAELGEDTDNVAITDVRFNNEAEFIRSIGGVVVHVVSGRNSTLATESQQHASEQGITFLEGDFVLPNRGTLAELPATVDAMMVFLGANHG